MKRDTANWKNCKLLGKKIDTHADIIRRNNIILTRFKSIILTKSKHISLGSTMRTLEDFSLSILCTTLIMDSNHGTITRTGMACQKIPCYMRDSAYRWRIVKKTKIFSSYIKHFWTLFHKISFGFNTEYSFVPNCTGGGGGG